MRNSWLLIKNYFATFLGRLFSSKKKTLKTSSALVLMLIFGVLFVGMFTSLAISTTEIALEQNHPEVPLYVNAAMAIMFVLLMTITKSTVPQKHSDEELLMSLPIKKSSIIFAKIIYEYIFDFLITLVTVLPAYIVYFILVETSVGIIFKGFLISLMIPMVSTALGYFLGLFFAFIASKFRHFKIVQSFLSLVLLIGFLGIYYYISYASTTGNETSAQAIMNFKPIEWIVTYVKDNNILSLLYLAIVTIIPFIILIVLRTISLGKTFKRYQSKTKTLVFKKQSLTFSLYKRELIRYFSLPIYVMNTFIGGIFLILISLILTVLGKSYIDNLVLTLNLNLLSENLEIVIILICLFSLSTICMSASSISIEGKTMWILKAHPVGTIQLFNSKILTNFTLGIVPIFISTILFAFNMGILFALFYFIILVLSLFSVSTLGLLINLIYPKLIWTNEAEVIKQSASVGICLFANMIISILPLVCYFIFKDFMTKYINLAIICLIYLLIACIIYIILVKKGKELFNKIEE